MCVGEGVWGVQVCVIYMVEVRDRIFTLAASRLSMMALGREGEGRGH